MCKSKTPHVIFTHLSFKFLSTCIWSIFKVVVMLIKEEKMQERGEVGKVQLVAASAQQVCTFLHIFAHFCHHHPVTRRKLGNLVSEHMLQVLKFKVCTQILMILSRGIKFWNHHLRLTSSKFCSWLASEVWRLSLLWLFFF